MLILESLAQDLAGVVDCSARTTTTKTGLPRATHGDPSKPLVVAGVTLPCYVLEDGTRVLSQPG